ncbi:MAG: 50S ribosomal protein L24 [Gemmatimonadetes bacterium]|nr:50S ribosomal protein L24 [Gemmatimonadota bacterium]
MARKIKKGDQVVVLRGNHRGKRGEVLAVLTDKQRVLVQGVNIIKRHTKPSGAQQGGIVEKEGSIAVSNVMLIDPDTDKPIRVGFRVEEDGRKVRIGRRSEKALD